MSSEVLAALILTVPSLLWAILSIIIVVLLYRPISRDLLPRMGGVQAFGVELTFLREGLERIVNDSSRSFSPQQADQVSRRAYRSATVLQGAKLLWIDDHPVNNNYERRFLNSVGVLVDIATSSEEADEMIRSDRSGYDLIISDVGRDGDPQAGLSYMEVLRRQGSGTPFLFYTFDMHSLDHNALSAAFGVAESPRDLLNFAMDILERERG